MNDKTWFNAKTILELKHQYKKLAKRYHPDVGGSDEIMSNINIEYNILLLSLFNVNIKDKNFHIKYQKNSESFRKCILDVNNVGIKVDISDNWVWVIGNISQNKVGYLWSEKNGVWYWYDMLILNNK